MKALLLTAALSGIPATEEFQQLPPWREIEQPYQPQEPDPQEIHAVIEDIRRQKTPAIPEPPYRILSPKTFPQPPEPTTQKTPNPTNHREPGNNGCHTAKNRFREMETPLETLPFLLS